MKITFITYHQKIHQQLGLDYYQTYVTIEYLDGIVPHMISIEDITSASKILHFLRGFCRANKIELIEKEVILG